MKITGAVSALPPLMEFIGGLAAVGALWYGAQPHREPAHMTPGEFTSFLAAAFMMYGPIKKLSRVNASLQQTIAASERIFEMLDTHTEVHERPGAPPLARLRRRVEFQRRRLRLRGRPEPVRPAPRSFTVRGRPGRRARRAERRGQDDARQSAFRGSTT